MTIELDEAQTRLYNNVIKLCGDIEKEMKTTIDPTIPEQVQDQLSKLLPYLSNLSNMVSVATAIYDWARGRVADEIMKNPNRFDDAKASVVTLHVQGRLAKYNALYARVESVSKNLRSSVEGLRSMLSYEKELINMNKFQPTQST
jgi:hypothetical protein